MYIFEYLIKKMKKKDKTAESLHFSDESQSDLEVCEHQFMPVDSTGEILSCIKCGLIKSRSELKYKNYF